MSGAIDDAIKQSQDAFINGVWPEVARAIGGGRIVPVEGVQGKEFLDMYAGIDHWHVLESKCLIRGIASRCQWPKMKRFQTFTIRIGRKSVETTELAKRLYAMDNADKGWVRPHLFIQAFFAPPWGSHTHFLYAGIAKMDDVLKIIRSGERDRDWYVKHTDAKWDQVDNKAFAVVPFETIKRLGYDFTLVEAKT